MNLIINFQKNYLSNLQNFLHFINKHNQTIKRDSSDNNSIRLLTIHGSKGLQAKVVFVLNYTAEKDKSDSLIFNNNFQTPLLILTGNEKTRPHIIQELINTKFYSR